MIWFGNGGPCIWQGLHITRATEADIRVSKHPGFSTVSVISGIEIEVFSFESYRATRGVEWAFDDQVNGIGADITIWEIGNTTGRDGISSTSRKVCAQGQNYSPR